MVYDRRSKDVATLPSRLKILVAYIHNLSLMSFDQLPRELIELEDTKYYCIENHSHESNSAKPTVDRIPSRLAKFKTENTSLDIEWKAFLDSKWQKK